MILNNFIAPEGLIKTRSGFSYVGKLPYKAVVLKMKESQKGMLVLTDKGVYRAKESVKKIKFKNPEVFFEVTNES